MNQTIIDIACIKACRAVMEEGEVVQSNMDDDAITSNHIGDPDNDGDYNGVKRC